MQPISEPLLGWSGSKKTLFRFCFLYFAIYIFFTPNSDIPWVNTVYDWLNTIFHRFIPWFANHFFGYRSAITIFTNGSGDTTYDYMLWLFGIVLTVIGTTTWTLLDAKRKSFNTLSYWLGVLLRYYLFYTMISYGLYKIIKVQFPFPSLNRLVEPFGDSSPMGLAWTFVGYSKTYNYFAGIAELSAGLFLLSRRTTTMGAILTLAVMTNVLMINLGYDVPVKLVACNTVLMSLFLLWKDGERLANFFILNKAVPPAGNTLPYTNRKLRYALFSIKWIFVIFIIWSDLKQVIEYQKEGGDDAPKPPLYGIYYTHLFVRNRDTLPPVETDTLRWKRLVISYQGFASIKFTNDTSRRYHFQIDTALKIATVFADWDTLNKSKFHYSFEPNYLTLSGKMKNDSIYIKMERFDEKRFNLVSRGFHLVNEYPFNR
jgi:uncharacterized membrane protein YphA (DoxX/SURF4 family)